jgi:hypothetical protein
MTYFIIRKNHHLGSCARRIASMTYLYNYYYSHTVNQIALRLGFAVLPDFIRDTVVTKLINVAMCSNGQYALAAYKTFPTPILSSTAFILTLASYLSVYNAIDSQLTWSVQSYEDSSVVFSTFDANPALYGGAFTLMSSKQEKQDLLTDPNMLTYSFANIAVVPLYHLTAFTASATASLRVTPQVTSSLCDIRLPSHSSLFLILFRRLPCPVLRQILAGIYTGAISMWNDPLIVAANGANGQYLPNKPIMVVARSGSTDANGIFLRFLALNSPSFQAMYASGGGGKYYRSFNFAALQAAGRLIMVTQNTYVDSQVIAMDGAFGYFLQTYTPTSNIASYCADPVCATAVVNPADNGRSIQLCELDYSTVYNPSPSVFSYDLMVSTTPGCYPIAGSVDMSIYGYQDPATCGIVDASGESIVHSKVKLWAFLFNGSAIVHPLATISAAPASNAIRRVAFKTVCDLKCAGAVLGYADCKYQDCAWINGDFTQVRNCNPLLFVVVVVFYPPVVAC